MQIFWKATTTDHQRRLVVTLQSTRPTLNTSTTRYHSAHPCALEKMIWFLRIINPCNNYKSDKSLVIRNSMMTGNRYSLHCKSRPNYWSMMWFAVEALISVFLFFFVSNFGSVVKLTWLKSIVPKTIKWQWFEPSIIYILIPKTKIDWSKENETNVFVIIPWVYFSI